MQPSNLTKTAFFNLFSAGTPFLALYTSAPNAADSSGTEVTGGSYARKAITFGTPNLTTGVMASTNAISFAAMPTANISYYAIRSAATGGTLLSYGPISAIATLAGDEVAIAVGNITITFAGS